MTYYTHSLAETQALGVALAEILRPGDVIAYTGDLGAGKTTMTQGIAQGLGVAEPVTSPTFTIVQEYLGGRIPLFHMDLYRLSGEDDLFDLGFEEYLYRGGVTVLEWSEIAGESLEKTISLDLRRGTEPDDRAITLVFTDGRTL